MTLTVRQQRDEDTEQVMAVVKAAFEAAFGSSSETVLIDSLQNHPSYREELSLVALSDGEVVGYLLLFPVEIRCKNGSVETLSLGPMAVAPKQQKGGIGSRLTEEGLRVAEALGYRSVVVLGHPDYYPKFGFIPAKRWDVVAPFEDLPSDLFFAMELKKGALEGVSGTVAYPAPFYDTLPS